MIEGVQKGAGQAAHPANDHHCKTFHDDLDIHPQSNSPIRACYATAQSGNESAQDEYPCE